MNDWTLEAWRGVVEAAPEGIVICDATAADHPVVFVNAAFSRMCGYPAAALLGNNLRMLQGGGPRAGVALAAARRTVQGRAGTRAGAQLPPRRLAVLERGGHPAVAQRPAAR